MKIMTRNLCAITLVLLTICLCLPVLLALSGLPLEARAQSVATGRQIVTGPTALDRAVARLPADTTQQFDIRRIAITGNKVITTEKLLKDIPLIYDASGKGITKADSEDLYDLRPLLKIVEDPGPPRQVSARTIQGFTQYLLGVYQDKGYAGIRVYVPADALEAGGAIEQGVLPIKVIEAAVADVGIAAYDTSNEPVEETHLQLSALRRWSPVEPGRVANRKKLDDYINLLNLNPDRYVSATVSRAAEPNSLNIQYNLHEADPWHWFGQVDNSGTDEREWAPRFGLINTNFLGFDDTFTAIYQVSADSEWDENYALYGSYDFPLAGPKLRLNLYGGYSEYDVTSVSDLDFLGRGSFYGATLRYNVFQLDQWFFDVLGGVRQEESKITPSLFPEFLESEVTIDLYNVGAEVHHTDDMSDTSIGFGRLESIGGSDESEFGLARTNAEKYFTVYRTTARHSQYLDPQKVQRLTGTFRWIDSDERLHPAEMSVFGGMYTVRGYDEYEIIADGGLLTSLQYEFDLVRCEQSKQASTGQPRQQKEGLLRKVAPLVFFDYGLARIEDATPDEDTDRELCSWGGGLIVELGENFTGTVYYGYPLIATEQTNQGKGRVSAGFLLRW